MPPRDTNLTQRPEASTLVFLAYCTGGAIVCLAYGIAALRNTGEVEEGVWLVAVAVAGAVAGAVLYFTREWHTRSRRYAIGRWTIAGLIAGASGGAVSFASGSPGLAAVVGGAAFGAVTVSCFSLYMYQHEWLVADEPRSPAAMARMWALILLGGVAVGLIAWIV